MVSEETVYQIQLQVQQPIMLEEEEETVMMLLTDKAVKEEVEMVSLIFQEIQVQLILVEEEEAVLLPVINQEELEVQE